MKNMHLKATTAVAPSTRQLPNKGKNMPPFTLNRINERNEREKKKERKRKRKREEGKREK